MHLLRQRVAAVIFAKNNVCSFGTTGEVGIEPEALRPNDILNFDTVSLASTPYPTQVESSAHHATRPQIPAGVIHSIDVAGVVLHRVPL